jgi:hypothetical protein
MLTRLTRRDQEPDDEEEPRVELLYGEPQHETGEKTGEKHLYGEPQHDVVEDGFPDEFDPDLGRAFGWLGRQIDLTFGRRFD